VRIFELPPTVSCPGNIQRDGYGSLEFRFKETYLFMPLIAGISPRLRILIKNSRINALQALGIYL